MSGVSGVGKTTVTDKLVDMYKWKVIPTFMTRALRSGEVDKITLSREMFLARKDRGDFFCVDEFYGNLYAVLINSINNAAQQKNELWVIDRPITKVTTYNNFSFVNIIILPEDEDQLKEQVMHCGRMDRLEGILQDYHENYVQYYSGTKSDNTFAIVNYRNQTSNVAQRVHNILENNFMNSHTQKSHEKSKTHN